MRRAGRRLPSLCPRAVPADGCAVLRWSRRTSGRAGPGSQGCDAGSPGTEETRPALTETVAESGGSMSRSHSAGGPSTLPFKNISVRVKCLSQKNLPFSKLAVFTVSHVRQPFKPFPSAPWQGCLVPASAPRLPPAPSAEHPRLPGRRLCPTDTPSPPLGPRSPACTSARTRGPRAVSLCLSVCRSKPGQVAASLSVCLLDLLEKLR